MFCFRGLLGLSRPDRLLCPVCRGFRVLLLHVFELARDVVTSPARRRRREPANDRELEFAVRPRQPILNAVHEPELFRRKDRIELFGVLSFGQLQTAAGRGGGVSDDAATFVDSRDSPDSSLPSDRV